MCGVWGMLGLTPAAAVIDECLKRLGPRGPGGKRVRLLKGSEAGKPQHLPVTLGFTRLAINGLTEAGMQPFSLIPSAGHPGPHPDSEPIPTTPHTPHEGDAHQEQGQEASRRPGIWVICNGEIYNYKSLAARHCIALTPGCSDCQPLAHLYHHSCDGDATAFARCLDGVFACLVVDEIRGRVVAVRDPFGVRPLFVAQVQGQDGQTGVAFASEVKGLTPIPGLTGMVRFQPGTARAWDLATGQELQPGTPEGDAAGVGTWFQPHWLKNPAYGPSDTGRAAARAAIRVSLDAAVRKRLLVADVPVGCLLSGGLDSSLVAALAQRASMAAGRPPASLHTFSIGMAGSSDLAHARLVAAHIGSTHHEVVLTPEQFLAAIPEVVRAIESYDITSVRASVGNYLVCQYIRAHTDVTVVLNGDGSDEASGSYLYFYNAPSDEGFEQEVCRLLKDIHAFDVLRSDRSVAAHGLEPRTPFLDRQFVATYCSIASGHRRPLRTSTVDAATGQVRRPAAEKQLLREAFDPAYTQVDVECLGQEAASPYGELHHLPPSERACALSNLHTSALSSGFPGTLLPPAVLWRRKEAFSDGVSSPEKSWYEVVQEHAAAQFPGGDEEWRALAAAYPPGPTCPYTAESVWYRRMFEASYGRDAASTIPYYWLPRWSGGAKDPSARTLAVYAETSESPAQAQAQAQAQPAGAPTGPALVSDIPAKILASGASGLYVKAPGAILAGSGSSPVDEGAAQGDSDKELWDRVSAAQR